VKQVGKYMNSASMNTIMTTKTRNPIYQSKTVSSYSEADAFCPHKIILTECNNRVCWDQKYTR
jgi:hypothetical protein